MVRPSRTRLEYSSFICMNSARERWRGSWPRAARKVAARAKPIRPGAMRFRLEGFIGDFLHGSGHERRPPRMAEDRRQAHFADSRRRQTVGRMRRFADAAIDLRSDCV